MAIEVGIGEVELLDGALGAVGQRHAGEGPRGGRLGRKRRRVDAGAGGVRVDVVGGRRQNVERAGAGGEDGGVRGGRWVVGVKQDEMLLGVVEQDLGNLYDDDSKAWRGVSANSPLPCGWTVGGGWLGLRRRANYGVLDGFGP